MRIYSFLITGVIALLTIGFTACQPQTVDPNVPVAAQGDSAVSRYARRLNLTGTRLASGLYYAITKANPTGKLTQPNEELEFTYNSYDTLGKRIDTTVAGSPTYYVLGLGALVKGLEQGLGLMREGESATFLIPFYLGYNDQTRSGLGGAVLPAYSPVRFDVNLRRSRTQQQQMDDYIALNKLTNVDTTTVPGVRIIKMVSLPGGAKPDTNQTLTYSYSAYLLRSTATFDKRQGNNGYHQLPTSADAGPVTKTAGFQAGLNTLRVGEQATFIFPASLGFGTTGLRNSDGTYVVTPYTPLRVTIQLTAAQ